MPITIRLIENGHIVHYAVTEPWTVAEILPIKAQSEAIFRSATHTLHALADLRGATMNLGLIQAAQQMMGGEQLPNSGEIAVVGVSRMIRMIAAPILNMVAGDNPVSFFDDVPQATAYLRRLIK